MRPLQQDRLDQLHSLITPIYKAENAAKACQHHRERAANYISLPCKGTEFYLSWFLMRNSSSEEKMILDGHIFYPNSKKEIKFQVYKNKTWGVRFLISKNIPEVEEVSVLEKQMDLLMAKIRQRKNKAGNEIRRTPFGYSQKRIIPKSTEKYEDARKLGIISRDYMKTAIDFKVQMIYTKSDAKQRIKSFGVE